MFRLPKSVVIPVAAVACTAVATLSRAQTSSAPKAAASAKAPATTKPFTPKRLPWGDPDISGNFTSKDEANTPFERPAEWAGRRLQDITPEEMAKANEQRRRQALADAP